ncbi:MAG: RNA polymerase-associated protein RapA [Gammaproteobacteria bacterium]|nr:MAG: RNA polymerase-associated protein RapA [Gammaproteobacteria bacterium]
MGSEFSLGQRWISDTEPELGLGIVENLDHRTVEIHFLSNDVARRYMIQNAPLTRAILKTGDTVHDIDQNQYLIVSKSHEGDLLAYHVTPIADENDQASDQRSPEPATSTSNEALSTLLLETRLSPHLSFKSARDRLFCGQIDKLALYNLRHDLCKYSAGIQQSDVFGLLGAKTSLIQHQYHIASEVAKRHAPRVLLADEVGLGKTIEAGLIIHQQLIKGLIKRVLILVPENLQHQWLVELLRKFNLQFSLFNEDRCESTPDNPFESAQLILCSIDWLAQSSQRSNQLLESEWDLLVVDEAHHLTPATDAHDPQTMPIECNKYALVENLARQTPGILLLTATPQQLGVDSHFERLKLLDPMRYHDVTSFQHENDNFTEIAQLIETLQSCQGPEAVVQQITEHAQAHLPADQRTAFIEPATALFSNACPDQVDQFEANKQQLIANFTDLHGTGRVLFRNTRASIKGFPGRKVHGIPLKLPEAYRNFDAPVASALCPERTYQDNKADAAPNWWQFDSRFEWLAGFITDKKDQKILIICHHARTVLNIEKALRTQFGYAIAMFHEGMNIIERDRAAAYFSDFDDGARILVCSEIGSEGRNFQFCHHLVLLDLPQCPDLLEQRIGRLDRIGQQETIKIYVPYFEHHPQAHLFRWYHHSLNCCERLSPAAQRVNNENQDEILALFFSSDAYTEADSETAPIDALLEKGRIHTEQLNLDIESGRDRILEINSSGHFSTEQVIDQIEEIDSQGMVSTLFTRLLDQYGLRTDRINDLTYVVKATDEMLVAHFPGINQDGISITFDREQALKREEWQFGSWDHPIIRDSFEMFLQDHNGTACVSLYPNKKLPDGTLLVEFLYIVDTPSNSSSGLNRFLPTQHIRILCGPKGQDLSERIDFETLSNSLVDVDKAQAKSLVELKADEIRALMGHSEKHAEQKLQLIKEHTQAQANSYYDNETSRLDRLKQNNAPVRDSEIEFFTEQKAKVLTSVELAGIRLDAIRVIFVA